MKTESVARLLPSSARASALGLCSLLAVASLLLLARAEGLLDTSPSDACASYEDFGGGSDHGTACSAAADSSFCFPSTLTVPLAGEPELGSKESRPGAAAFKLADGGAVICSLACKAPPVPDSWIRPSSGETIAVDGEPGGLSSPPHIEINPPLLNWGTQDLYSPSLAFLTVTNSNNGSLLDVYPPFSTDPQFYTDGFDTLTLSPGEATSIAFVFLPKRLGSSSAHLVLQTSVGGFIVNAKGLAVESPYGLRSLVGINMPLYRKSSVNLSLYNPFDDVLYVEEAAAWISSSCESTCCSSHFICSQDGDDDNGSHGFRSLLNDDEWCAVENGDMGVPSVELRPQGKWEVPPNGSQAVVELNLWPGVIGKVFGAICVNMHNSRGDISDRIVVPVELEVQGVTTYHALTGSVSAYFESLMLPEGMGPVFILSLRNSSPYLLSVVNITEEAVEGLWHFKVKYFRGLVAYPWSVTQIAFISYASFDSQDALSKISTSLSNCKLVILTNYSASPQIEIPCRDIVHDRFGHGLGVDNVASDDSYIGLEEFQQENAKSTNAKTDSLGSVAGEPTSWKLKILEGLEEDELILRSWRSQGTMSGVSVLEDHELMFPVVQIGSHYSKWITMHNPSHKPVIMQLLLNCGAITDQCQSAEDSSKVTVSSRFVHIDKTCDGFSVEDSAITEALVHPFGSASFGPIVFRPSSQCMWRSSVLIRNNLTGVEWLPLRAFGGSHSLILLEGSKPIWELEFKFDLPVTLNSSSLESLRHLNDNASCTNLLSKELYAKNTGKFPLEVIELGVSGSDCGLDGFIIHTCKGFSLSPGESMRLLISYQSDFSSAVIHRDLKLAMTTGILVIPMKASLPIHMLNLCKKRVFWTVLVKPLLLMVAAVFIVLLVFSILLHAFPSSTKEYFVKGENTGDTISRGAKPSCLHLNPRKTRLVKEDEKPETALLNTKSHSQSGDQGTKQNIKEKQVLNHQKEKIQPTASSTPVGIEVFETSDIVETPQKGNLTVKVVRERGRRRKRRTTGVGLAAKLEVSSSQSGNSTPSSPLSPGTSTPKQVWPLSADTPDRTFSSVSEKSNQGKKKEFGVPTEVCATETGISIKSFDNSVPSVQDQPCTLVKPIYQPSLLPSATFPCSSGRAPRVATSDYLVSPSPIALHARAPGSKINKEGSTKKEEGDMPKEEFTYDIWGNHFSDRFIGLRKEYSTRVYGASEGDDSHSFFSRDPQSLMMMSSALSVSPVSKLIVIRKERKLRRLENGLSPSRNADAVFKGEGHNVRFFVTPGLSMF